MAGNLTKAAATFWGSIIAQTWEDDAFKQKLIDNADFVNGEYNIKWLENQLKTEAGV